MLVTTSSRIQSNVPSVNTTMAGDRWTVVSNVSIETWQTLIVGLVLHHFVRALCVTLVLCVDGASSCVIELNEIWREKRIGRRRIDKIRSSFNVFSCTIS